MNAHNREFKRARVPLPWRWFLALVGFQIILLMAVNLGLRWTLPDYLRQVIRNDLERNALLARSGFAALLADPPANAERINSLARSLSVDTGLRITIMDAGGKVLGESGRPPEEVGSIENHLLRPEIQQALADGIGSNARRSTTVGVPLQYVAVRVFRDPPPEHFAARSALGGGAPNAAMNVLGFVRVALPLVQVERTIAQIERTVAVASVMVGLVTIPLVFWMSQRVTIPLENMHDVATRVARGDFSRQVPLETTSGDLRDLAMALNDMSAQLQNRLRDLADEKAELNATLTHMIEGVLVVDEHGKIRLANRALQQQMNVSELIIGRTVMEALRNAALQDLVNEALGTEQATAREMTFYGDGERVFDVNAARLRSRDKQNTGAVIVFHDITRIKRLENMRKDFVANVSHELRTPLSIIKGYVETLIDEPGPDATTAREFLKTIQKHAKRLETLIADLLTISALESQQSRLNIGPISLKPIAEAVRQELAPQAAAKNIVVDTRIDDKLPLVRGEGSRLHQVMVNLIDNAVKYTPSGGRVTVTAHDDPQYVYVCVADNGPGISAEHLSRIFERFYRIDQARSRDLGGTGLGLSIVKHIVQAHGGRVWAESEPGDGSKFYFTLPRA